MNLLREEAKWPVEALEALRIQAEQAGPSLAAKQAYINGLEFELRKALQSRMAEGEQEPCAWTSMDRFEMPGSYETACGHAWSFTEGDLSDNKIVHCPFCGNHIAAPQGAPK